MNAYQQLKDISNNFEQQLRTVSEELFSIKTGESFEDGIAKELQDLTLLTSKLRLLEAKTLSGLPQITECPKSEDSIKKYGEQAQWKVLEQCICKSMTQSHAVKALIMTPDSNLDPEMVERKENIISSLREFRNQESQLRNLQAVEEEKEAELAAVRKQWDREMNDLREMREEGFQLEEFDVTDSLYKKLRGVVDKLELIRWLMGCLISSRGSRDWLAMADKTAHLLKRAQQPHTVASFLQSDLSE